MKFTLLALCLAPLTAAAYEVSDVQFVGQLNGHFPNCNQSQDLARDAYVPELTSASANDDQASFRVKMSFELCAGDRDNQHWVSRRPLDSITTTDLDGNPVRVEFRQPEFVFGYDDGTNIAVLPATNDAEQTVTLQFPFAAQLTPAEKADLAAGRPVRLRAMLIYRAIGTAYTVNGQEPLGYRFGPTYTVFFTLKK